MDRINKESTKLQVTVTMLRVLNKRRENARSIIYSLNDNQKQQFKDEEMRSIMRDMRHLTSLRTINLNFIE
jgi:two-component sensor histidine kinase